MTALRLASSAAAILLAKATPAVADSPDVRRVLVIDAERGDRPLWAEITSTFMPALRERSREPVEVFYEAIDVARFGAGGHLDRFQSWLDVKYRDQPPNVVLATGPLTYHLMAHRLEHLPAGTPVVVGTVREQTAMSRRSCSSDRRPPRPIA